MKNGDLFLIVLVAGKSTMEGLHQARNPLLSSPGGKASHVGRAKEWARETWTRFYNNPTLAITVLIHLWGQSPHGLIAFSWFYLSTQLYWGLSFQHMSYWGQFQTTAQSRASPGSKHILAKEMWNPFTPPGGPPSFPAVTSDPALWRHLFMVRCSYTLCHYSDESNNFSAVLKIIKSHFTGTYSMYYSFFQVSNSKKKHKCLAFLAG